MTNKTGEVGNAQIQNNSQKTDKNDDATKDRPLRKGKKKEKEKEKEASGKASLKSRIEKRLLVLPFETSLIALFLIVLLGAFYVVWLLCHCVLSNIIIITILIYCRKINFPSVSLLKRCLITKYLV